MRKVLQNGMSFANERLCLRYGLCIPLQYKIVYRFIPFLLRDSSNRALNSGYRLRSFSITAASPCRGAKEVFYFEKKNPNQVVTIGGDKVLYFGRNDIIVNDIISDFAATALPRRRTRIESNI